MVRKRAPSKRVIPYRSVHLDARMISPRCGMKCGGFLTCFFVQQDARYARNKNVPCAIRSCNKLHATGGKVYVDYSELR